MVEKKLITPPPNDNYEVELIQPGNKVFPFRGKINFADPSYSQDTGSFMVRASVPNPKKELRPGMFVTVNLHGAVRPNAVVIPQLALQQGSKGHFVLVANAQDKVEMRPVAVGTYANNKEIVVEQGLHAGDRVIVDGFARLAPNAPVKPVPAGQAQPSAPAATPAPAKK